MKRIIYIYLQFIVLITVFIACDKVDEESFINEEPKQEQAVFFLQNDQIVLEQNQSQLIFFLKNDSVPEKVDINFSNPKNGKLSTKDFLSISSITDYTITYIPNDNFVGKDSIIYTLCNEKGLCKTATIYLTVQGNTTTTTDHCDFTIPFIIQEVKLLPNQIDSFFLDLSHISCPLTISVEGDIKGWINSAQINENQFLINYKSPEKGGFYEKIQLKICVSLGNYCEKSMMLYDVQSTVCSNWLAKDDVFKTDTIMTEQLIIPIQKLYANDDYCVDKKIDFSIIQFPTYGKLVVFGDEVIYYPTSKVQEDFFTYKICNEQGQCSQADVKLISN